MSLPPRAPPVAAYWPTGRPHPPPSLASVGDMTWAVHAGNPLIQAALPSLELADPSFLPPSETPDGQWHLFARDLQGLRHYRSADGLRWSLLRGVVARLASRPHLLRERGRTYLVTERGHAPWSAGPPQIELRSSADLLTWTAPRALLRPSLPWHREGGIARVGAPCLLTVGDRFRLYYSAGQGGLLGVAEADHLDAAFTPEPEPLPSLGPAGDPGALKVLACADGFLGVHSTLPGEREGGEVRLLRSADGRSFEPLADTPIRTTRGPSGAPALDARWDEGHLLIFFTAPGGRLGRGGVGLAVGA